MQDAHCTRWFEENRERGIRKNSFFFCYQCTQVIKHFYECDKNGKRTTENDGNNSDSRTKIFFYSRKTLRRMLQLQCKWYGNEKTLKLKVCYKMTPTMQMRMHIVHRHTDTHTSHVTNLSGSFTIVTHMKYGFFVFNMNFASFSLFYILNF